MHSPLGCNKVECLKAPNFLLFLDNSGSLDCLCNEKANGAICSKSHPEVIPILESAGSASLREFDRK